MKLIMTLLVRDEDDIIEDNIRYHLSQGVDHFIIMDNLSQDGTRPILDRFAAAGIATVISQEDDDYSQSDWVTSMARQAFEMGADWVINSDADEFWWPNGGNLKELAERYCNKSDILIFPRHNLPPLLDQFGDVENFSIHTQIFREVVSYNADQGILPPKVMHKAFPDVVVSQGNHSVHSDSFSHKAISPCALIFHYPMRGSKQFENKIINGGKAYARNSKLPQKSGSTWRNLYKLYLNGELNEFFLLNCIRSKERDRLISQGLIVKDVRISNFLMEPVEKC